MKQYQIKTKKLTSKEKKENKQLIDILKQHAGIDLEIKFIQIPNAIKRLTIEKDRDIEEASILKLLQGAKKGDWVHLRVSTTEWKQMKLNTTLMGQHKSVRGVTITYGRWNDLIDKRTSNFTKDLGYKPYAHTVGMIHEYYHSKDGSLALTHSYLYGYDRIYSRIEETRLKPKRYQVQPSIIRLLTHKNVPLSNDNVKVDTVVVHSLYKPKNFDINELVPPSVHARLGEEACWQLFDRRLLKNLQWLRDRFGITYVNNGSLTYRGFDDGGFRKNGTSQHNHGRAIDCHFKHYTIKQVHDILSKEYINMPEPNIWVEKTSGGKPITWLHMDVRYSDKQGIYYFNA